MQFIRKAGEDMQCERFTNGKAIIQRNTTPTLKVTVFFDVALVKEIEFVFTKTYSEHAEILAHKKYTKDTMQILSTESTGSFEIAVDFEREETMKLSSETVYMGTRITDINGKIPRADTVEIDVQKNLFSGVYPVD